MSPIASSTSVCYQYYIDVSRLSVTFDTLFAIFTPVKLDRKLFWPLGGVLQQTSPFDSPTPILYRQPVANFRPISYHKNLFECFDLHRY
jgi:hypothetical protein